MEIRPTKKEDIPAIIAIAGGAPELAASDESLFWSAKRLEKWIEADQDVLLSADEDEEVVGFILTQTHYPSEGGYLSDIAVRDDMRRRGIGRALLTEAISQLQGRGLTYIYGLSEFKNKKMHDLLEQEGFHRGESMVWFEKKINR